MLPSLLRNTRSYGSRVETNVINCRMTIWNIIFDAVLPRQNYLLLSKCTYEITVYSSMWGKFL